jgi:hypothetical protein
MPRKNRQLYPGKSRGGIHVLWSYNYGDLAHSSYLRL